MWDIPVERKQQKKIADQAFGHVLVAGYGLGLVQYYLAKNPRVKSITTVERFPEVIKEVTRVYGKVYGAVAIADFQRFATDKKYDCIIGDIWEDITEQSLPKYNRFTKRAKRFLKRGGKILAWGQGFFEYLNTQSSNEKESA